MINSRYFHMHQRDESIEAKRKTSSPVSHLSNSRRQRESLRRTWSNGLPSLATNTVKMVVATLQVDNAMSDFSEEIFDEDNDQEQYDDEYDDILNIGQHVRAHIPDIVLDNFKELTDQEGNLCIPNEHNYPNCTLLFLDVSGFTALTEQYSNDTHLGIDQLTRTLNSYFDKLVNEILIQHGDLYKFAGDAILALWSDEMTGPERALKCALHLQQKCGAYQTNVGVVLHLKVALAYGFVRALFVGTDEFKHYLLVGDGVKDVTVSEQLCEPGDIIITKALHEKLLSTSVNCEFVPFSKDTDDQGQEHIAVKYSQSRRSSIGEGSDPDNPTDNPAPVSDRLDPSNQEMTNGDNDELTPENKTLDAELESKIDLSMKSFLLPSVSQRIERKQSLYYLSELRRVTIAFINLNISDEEASNRNLTEDIHTIFCQIYELTKMMGGVLTKALLFDKGWSFLCVFGLPGYKQGDDTANALKCAQMIHSTIREQCQFVEKCSIGVATGLTYCGVVGHRERCEYTVIGRKVNMAARLMCNYPNVISCDQETYYNSRLHSRFFQILPAKVLKGMNDVGIIWQYGEYEDLSPVTEEPKSNPSRQISDIRLENYPLLGRRVELMTVVAQIMLLDEPVSSSNKRRDLAAIIFEGEDKIGRSRLLQFITDSLENSVNVHNFCMQSYYDDRYIPNNATAINTNNIIIPRPDSDIQQDSSLNNYANDCSMIKRPLIQVISHRCQFEQRFTEFGLLRSLLKQLLQFHNDQNQHEREQYLLRLFDINKANDLHLRRNLFLLNDLLDIRFRRSHIQTESNHEHNLVKTYEANINELLLHILNKLIDPPNNIGEAYQPIPLSNIANKSCTLYSQSGVLTTSTNSLSCSTIPTVSKIIFIIDDIHFSDQSSLKHLLTLGSHSRCLLILSLKPPRSNGNDLANSMILQSIKTDSRVYLRQLPGLELRYLATLGCQLLSVHRIPTQLIKVFNESCHGIPGFCEQILFDLLSKDKIYIVDDNDSQGQDSNLIEGDAEKLLLNNPIKNGLFKTFFSRRKQSITPDQRQKERAFARLCLVRNPDESDFNVDCQQNFQNYIMCRIDRLSEGESLLVKIATIIGNNFSRMFLWHLVDPQSKKLINITSCILEMMQRMVIECAYRRQQITQTRSIKCYCLQNPAGFPSQCRLMAFTHSTIREGIYSSLTDGLKRLLTRYAIDYLEKQCSITCLACGANRNDTPFLVHEHDGLSKIIKSRQHHALVDIVKVAALKEIDNTIKELSRMAISYDRSRSNSSSKILRETLSTEINETIVDHTGRLNVIPTKRQHSMCFPSVDPEQQEKKSESCNAFTNDLHNDDIADAKPSSEPQCNSSDPNLTLISVYSSNAPPKVQVNLQRSSSTAGSTFKSSQLFSLFRVPRRASSGTSISNTDALPPVDGTVADQSSDEFKVPVDEMRKRKQDRSERILQFVRYLFCQFVPIGSNAIVAPSADELLPPLEEIPSVLEKENAIVERARLNWKKVRRAVLPTYGQTARAIPNEDELLEQSMFSSELMRKVDHDLQCINKQISFTQTFEYLYDQSFVFHVFQSYVQRNHATQFVYECKQTKQVPPDLNQFLNEFNSYSDLRICECADHVMIVYSKLVGYHTNLYDIYEKVADDKRDYLRLKQFDRIMYYRIEICRLLLRCNCLQRLLIEIEKGRKFLEKFENDTNKQEDFIYQYQYFITKYTFDLFQAILFQHSRAMNKSKEICEHSLKDLNRAYEEQIWEKIMSNIESGDGATETEKKAAHGPLKEPSIDLGYSTQLCISSSLNSKQLIVFDGKYRLEYLLCQYHLLQYTLSRHESIESVNKLIDYEYYTFPLTFSLPCTVKLVEYFYCRLNFDQCLRLIDQIIHFWWAYVSPREKLEFAKLRCLSLIIELKRGSLDSAILSGYFAKRILTGYHENIFLIESSIHLTLALIGEMRVANIEFVLQHLEYLSEQTMNCYAKLWYYILVIDVAMELGYELLPISMDFLTNITKYRKRLPSGSKDRSLLLVYSDCILSQIYARLGLLDASKIHFHQVLHQFKHDQMHLSNADFRFKRAVLKLIEIQLLHWYHSKDVDQSTMINDFLLNRFHPDEFSAWNKSRFLIYQAYYDRLINHSRGKDDWSIDNDLNWEESLREAEQHSIIKLDSEWIKRLRKAWSHPVSEQEKLLIPSDHPRRLLAAAKPANRRLIRLSVPHIKLSVHDEPTSVEQSIPIVDGTHQKFLNWRLFLNNNNVSQFQLYILPVRV